jgi:hypothetical protein
VTLCIGEIGVNRAYFGLVLVIFLVVKIYDLYVSYFWYWWIFEGFIGVLLVGVLQRMLLVGLE